MQRHIKLTGFLLLLVLGSAITYGVRTQTAIGSDNENQTSRSLNSFDDNTSRLTDIEPPQTLASPVATTSAGSSPKTLGRRAGSLKHRMKSIRRSLSERATQKLPKSQPEPISKPIPEPLTTDTGDADSTPTTRNPASATQQDSTYVGSTDDNLTGDTAPPTTEPKPTIPLTKSEVTASREKADEIPSVVESNNPLEQSPIPVTSPGTTQPVQDTTQPVQDTTQATQDTTQPTQEDIQPSNVTPPHESQDRTKPQIRHRNTNSLKVAEERNGTEFRPDAISKDQAPLSLGKAPRFGKNTETREPQNTTGNRRQNEITNPGFTPTGNSVVTPVTPPSESRFTSPETPNTATSRRFTPAEASRSTKRDKETLPDEKSIFPSGSAPFHSENNQPAPFSENIVETTPATDSTRASEHLATEELNTIFISQSPVLRVATTGPRIVVVGKDSVYTVKVQNASETAASGVVVDVKIPAQAEVIETTPTIGHARHESVGEQEGRIRWSIDQVNPHAIEEIAIRLIPRDSHSFDLSVNWSFNPNASVAQIEVQEPKLEVLLTGPSDVFYGESKIYTITVRNPGTGDAENVVLNLLPINRNDSAGVRRLGLLPAGHSERIDVELTAQQPGQIWIRAQAFGDNGLRAEVAEEVLVRRANLEVSLVAPDVKYAGTVVEYEVSIVNTGDAPADNVVATAVLPQGAEYVNSGDENAEYDQASGRVHWSLGNLISGGQHSVRLKCVLGNPGENRVEVVAEASDDLAAFQSAVTVVEALADLKLTVEDPQGPVSVEDTAVYEVRLVNRGSKSAERIRVYAFFSEGIEPTEVLGGQSEIEPGQIVFEEIDRLGPGQEVLFKISAHAMEIGDHIFRAEVTCEDPETELAAQETTRFYGQTENKESAELEGSNDKTQAANGAAAVRR